MKEIQLHRIDLNLLVVFEALMLEGSVAGAASQLNKTPSAVSHALARLREQVGDPLMVKVGGRMQASPFALQLIEDIRPLLSGIKRVLQLPEPFDPKTSARTFRIECPVSANVLSTVANRILEEAPHINIDWLAAPHKLQDAVAERHIDLANLGGDSVLPDGVDEQDMPPMNFTSFVRAGHPAIKQWGPQAWNHYGHIKVAITNAARSPVDEASSTPKPERRIAARISEFSAVGPLLASTDLIATLPPEIMAWDMQTYGLVLLPAITPMPPFRVRFFWSSRTANDPAMVWVRNLVMGAYREAQVEATALVAARIGRELTL
ncbi:LysR family transcriptional regulator [Algirhabdus cladophorae]|uniref:LysR family transcriptional regulator n=1 Tax=Algirhabdus cladophorae TaxID=3377108 RepID=UPI003B84834C